MSTRPWFPTAATGPRRARRSRGLRLALIVCVAAVAAACGGADAEEPTTPPRPVTATAQETVRPFTPAGEPAPGIRIVDEASAKCSASGVDLTNPTARRCMTTDGYLLYDPCFVRATPPSDTALCLREPDSRDAVRIHVVEDAGPAPPSSSADRPWFLELADGRRCVLAPTPDPADPGPQPTYTCGQDDHLYGLPDRSARVWTIANDDSAEPDDAGGTHRRDVRIRNAWF